MPNSENDAVLPLERINAREFRGRLGVELFTPRRLLLHVPPWADATPAVQSLRIVRADDSFTELLLSSPTPAESFGPMSQHGSKLILQGARVAKDESLSLLFVDDLSERPFPAIVLGEVLEGEVPRMLLEPGLEKRLTEELLKP